jgi:ADP-heptose:LPS heptosyltransferase
VKILAIRLARFGDIVLLLPSLKLLKAQFPQSRLIFLTDTRWRPLAEMCPAIDEVIAMDRLAMRDGSVLHAAKEIAGVARTIRRQRFDLVVDFHGLGETNALTLISGAPQRLGLRRFDQSYWGFCFNLPAVDEDKEIHVSEMFDRVARRLAPQAPKQENAIVVPVEAREWATQNLPKGPLAALYIDAPVSDRMWPAEHFAVVANHLIQRFDAGVIVLSGPGRTQETETLLSKVAARDRVRALSGLSIPQLAAAIGSA